MCVIEVLYCVVCQSIPIRRLKLLSLTSQLSTRLKLRNNHTWQALELTRKKVCRQKCAQANKQHTHKEKEKKWGSHQKRLIKSHKESEWEREKKRVSKWERERWNRKRMLETDKYWVSERVRGLKRGKKESCGVNRKEER